MMVQYTKLSGEIKKRQAQDEEANENVDSLLKELRKANAPRGSEVIAHEEESEASEEGQGRQDVLGTSAAEAALQQLC